MAWCGVLLALAACHGCATPAGSAAARDAALDPRQQSTLAAAPQPDARPDACLAAALMKALGKRELLLGAQMDDAIAAGAPFDLRYLYIAGGVADAPGPLERCPAGGKNPWWGCWQWEGDPPGRYVRDFVDRVSASGQLPMITWYQFLHASGVADGVEEVPALNDPQVMSRYLADWRFLLQQIKDRRVLLHIEPDLWGYAQHVDAEDPRRLPAAVRSANPRDCGDLTDTVADVGRCMIRMARKYAPNAKVGLHASFWATKVDVSINRDPALDVVAEAKKTARYLRALGAEEGDFIVIGATDRDAAYYQKVRQQDRWWDPEDRALPHFAQAFTWARTVSESLQRPHLWWQLPLGHERLPNENTRWQDNRVSYFFAHPDRVVRAHGFGMAFGAGQKDQTNPSTDDGHFLRHARRYLSGSRPPVCP